MGCSIDRSGGRRQSEKRPDACRKILIRGCPFLAHDDYQGAALATPDRKLAWVFGREPTMNAARYEALVAKLVERGVDASALQRVPQVAPGGG